MYSKFAPDDHGTRFSTWRRSEDIVSRVTGVVWIILVLVQNDREKKTKTKTKTLLMALVVATLGLPKIAVP